MSREKSFLVRTTGSVVEEKSKVFVVKAPAKEIAQEHAADIFCEEFDIAGDSVQVRVYGRRAKAIIAIICMSVSIFLSFIPWMNNHDALLIRPDLISCIFSIAFYAVFVIRFKGIQNALASALDIAFIPIVVLLVSSFLQAILVKKTISLFGIVDFSLDTRIILVVALLFSAFGLKLASVVCMGILLIYSLVNVAMLSNAMGPIWGPIYIICAFVGLLAYVSIEPTIIESIPHYKQIGNRFYARAKADVFHAGQSAQKIGKKVYTKIDEKRASSEKQVYINKKEKD